MAQRSRCPGQGSNLGGLRPENFFPPRLPVPPPGRAVIIVGARLPRAPRREGCPALTRSPGGSGRLQELGEDGCAGDDRRRALRHQPAHIAPLGQRERRQPASSAPTVAALSTSPSTSSGISSSSSRSIVASVVIVPATPIRSAPPSSFGSSDAAWRAARPATRGRKVLAEEPLRQTHAADVDAGRPVHALRAARDQLGAAAADIADHDRPLRRARLGDAAEIIRPRRRRSGCG